MNIQRIKALVWISALAIGGYLGYFIYGFLEAKPTLSQPVDNQTQLGVLEGVQKPPTPKQDLVDYDEVKGGLITMNWTGYEPPPPVVVETQEGPVETPKTPVTDLLLVKVVQVDTDAPEESFAYVEWKDPQLKAANPTAEDRTLHMGDKLDAPYANIEVIEILSVGVLFGFGDDERDNEIVPIQEFLNKGGGIAKVADGETARTPVAGGERKIPVNEQFDRFSPETTILIGTDTYQIGTKDAEFFGENYSTILSREVSYRKHRDPRTGQIDGIEITRVASGSFASRHGIKGGEVIKSINGHPVKSVNEAIAFVKKEQDHTSTWEVVYEKQGREYTTTYHSD